MHVRKLSVVPGRSCGMLREPRTRRCPLTRCVAYFRDLSLDHDVIQLTYFQGVSPAWLRSRPWKAPPFVDRRPSWPHGPSPLLAVHYSSRRAPWGRPVPICHSHLANRRCYHALHAVTAAANASLVQCATGCC